MTSRQIMEHKLKTQHICKNKIIDLKDTSTFKGWCESKIQFKNKSEIKTFIWL